MRILAIACLAIWTMAAAGCSGELAVRPPANDPGNAAAAEAPYHPPPAYQPDPLLDPAPKRAEPPAAPKGGGR
jgi:hypothetical protein